jgi:hypothetical protein
VSSPPYTLQRLYLENGVDLGVARDTDAWIEWQLEILTEAQRVVTGPIFWVVSGPTKDRRYQPACEGLAYLWWKRGGNCHQYRPCVWHKVDRNGGGTGIPGSGGSDYLRADWEYVLCFKRPGALPYFDVAAVGHAPKYSQVGGEMSNRNADGRRINAEDFGVDPWNTGGLVGISGRHKDGRKKDRAAAKQGMSGPTRRANGKYKKVLREMDCTAGHEVDGQLKENGNRPMPKFANPGNVILIDETDGCGGVVRARVGGGHIGSKLAHEGEAPYPERLCEFFIKGFSRPGDTVADCFSGSGTTAAVSVRLGRNFLGCDLRQSQVDLAYRRLAEEADKESQSLFTE